MQKADEQPAKSTAVNRPSDRPPFYRHYTDQPTASPVENWRILSKQFYCPHALADSNQRI